MRYHGSPRIGHAALGDPSSLSSSSSFSSPPSKDASQPSRRQRLGISGIMACIMDLPDEALENVLSQLNLQLDTQWATDKKTGAALRLVCKRFRALVDRGIVFASDDFRHRDESARRWQAPSEDYGRLLREREQLIQALIRPSWNLRELRISSLLARGAAAITAADWPNLEGLNVQGFYEIADLGSGRWPRLKRLELWKCTVDADAAAALAGAHWPELLDLSLKASTVSADAAPALVKGRWPKLEVLCLEGADCGVRGAAAIGAVPWPNLKSLTLDNVKLGDDGAAALGSGMGFPSLETLELRFNGFTAQAMAGLARAYWPKLTMIRIGEDVYEPLEYQRDQVCDLRKQFAEKWPNLKNVYIQLPYGEFFLA